VIGRSASPDGRGVLGFADSSSGTTYGVFGRSASTYGRGVLGFADSSSGITYGVIGRSASTSGTGVLGYATASSGTTYGVSGESDSSHGYGVYGYGPSAYGYGVYSHGRFAASGTKSFQIDHPLDPANQYLNHFSAEGPEPYLIYRGSAILDETGQAWVQLPDYFESINRDFHYQLTPIGKPALLYIAEEVRENRFLIAGGEAGMKVSWTVTGVRDDPFVQAYPLADVQDKPAEAQGLYLQPELYGQPESLGIHYMPRDREADDAAALSGQELVPPEEQP
jgi:hypothetical protein